VKVRPRIGRRLRALARTTLPWVALSALCSLGLGPVAHADPSAPSNTSDVEAARATSVSAQADQLQRRLDRALLAYQTSLQGLAGAANASVRDERASLAVAALEQQAVAGEEERVRAIYMSGGSVGLVGSILSAQTPRDLASRLANVSAVVNLGSVVTGEARLQAASARAAALSSRSAVRRQVTTVQDVQAAYQDLTVLLAQTRARAQRLTDQAERLAAQERLAAARAAAAAAATSAAASVSASGIPTDFLGLYQAAAATCNGLPWVVLAAVGQVESGHGSNNGPSPSGAEGPMQFLPSTFAGYAVDGDGDGDADIWDPADSIYTAARYLCANGGGRGPGGLYSALWNYNHADWYVQLVIGVAGQLADRFGEPVPAATSP